MLFIFYIFIDSNNTKFSIIMKLSVQPLNFEIAKQLDDFISKKTARFGRHLREDDELSIRLSVVKPATIQNKQADVRIGDLFASKTCDTFEQAISEALDALESRLENRKEKE